MPVLMRTSGEHETLVVSVKVRRFSRHRTPTLSLTLQCSLTYIKNLIFKFNVQHDCAMAGCTATGRHPLMQERRATANIDTYIEHKDVDRWIINTLGFHNAHLIRQMLPRNLWAPIPLHADRQLKHTEFAAMLRKTRNTGRAAQKARAEAKKATTASTTTPETSADPNSDRRKRCRKE